MSSGIRMVMAGTGSDPQQQAPFDALGDEVVLKVFQWLPWEDLLRGPAAVSRRWRRLARDASVWSGQSVNSFSEAKTLAVLRFAPTLHSLHYNGHPWTKLARVAQETDCAVTQLRISGMFLPVRGEDSSFLKVDVRTGLSQQDEAMLALLRRQVALGRLRRFKGFQMEERIKRELVSTALQAPLTELDISVNCDCDGEQPAGSDPPQPLSVPHCPSLQTLRYDMRCLLPDSVIPEALVSAHAPSLRSVALLGMVSTRAVTLLSQCSQLRAAELQVKPGLASISACPLLTELTLVLHSMDHGDPLISFAFLRSAIQLTKLTLQRYVTGWPFNLAELDLFMELGKSGQSKLMALHIHDISGGGNPAEPGRFFARLFKVIPEPGFPLLQELYLANVPAVALLERIAPRLRVLSFEAVYWCAERCLYPACCYPAFPRLVAQHPRLHVLSIPASHQCVSGRCSCCIRGQHDIATRSEPWGKVSCCSLYAHGEREQCGVDHGRASEWRLVAASSE